MITHRLMQGRWLRPGDTDAMVLNHIALAQLPNVRVGDVVSLIVEQRPVQLRVVGIAQERLTPGAAYTTPETFARTMDQAGRTNAVRIVLKNPGALSAVSRSIERALAREGVGVRLSMTEAMFDEAQTGHVYILVFALISMAMVMAVVGTLGVVETVAEAGERVAEAAAETNSQRSGERINPRGPSEVVTDKGYHSRMDRKRPKKGSNDRGRDRAASQRRR